MITNRHNLPAPLHEVAQIDNYSRGEANISVTELISAPRIRLLKAMHGDDIHEDVDDRIWLMLGSGFHAQAQWLEKTGYRTERRYHLESLGWIWTGQVDGQQSVDNGISIYDYKVTSVYKVMSGSTLEWEEQQNCYAHLVETADHKRVVEVYIIAIMRDWSRADMLRDSRYPRTKAIKIPVRLWPAAERERYINERIRLHQDAEQLLAMGEAIPPCTDKDRWVKPSQFAVYKPKPGSYAVYKPDGSRAFKVLDNHAEATILASELGGWVKVKSEPTQSERAFSICESRTQAEEVAGKFKGATVEERRGSPVRCAGNYCGVNTHCDQWRRMENPGVGLFE